MTTILSDFRLGLMVADSNISDGNRVWVGRKVFRCKGALLGFAGDVNQADGFLAWWRRDCTGQPPAFGRSEALVMTAAGLLVFSFSLTPKKVRSGIESIGTGGKAAICAYEAMENRDPVRAVRLACKHDSESRGPVRIYRMKRCKAPSPRMNSSNSGTGCAVPVQSPRRSVLMSAPSI